MTDATGAKVELTEYVPYGEMREHQGTEVTNYKFTDQELDPETGLYNYGARLYDPVIGRFISPDTIIPDVYDPQMLNRYSYCRNNPLIYTDPTGHLPDGGYGSYGTTGNLDGGGKSEGSKGGGGIGGFLKGLADKLGLTRAAKEAKEAVQDLAPKEQGPGLYYVGPETIKEGVKKGATLAGLAGLISGWISKALGLGEEDEAEKNPATPTITGKSRAPKKGVPNSIYEQVDDEGKVRSRTFYDENGHPFAKQHFNHPHYPFQEHEETRDFDEKGRPITKEDTHALPPGYDNEPTGP